MTVFVTGATGFIGSYVVTNLLEHSDQNLLLLVRASCRRQAAHKLWKALQLHMQFDRFLHYLQHRIELVPGDLTAPELGLDPDLRLDLGRRIESIVHCAASLNRKSAKACFNVNLRGTLSLAKLARAAHEHHGLRRLSEVSTTAVAGKREHELVREEDAIDWSRSDYDPYARTKKFCEHMLCELLPDVPLTIFRPSIVLGDSRFAETTQFDMAIAFAALARTPVLPFDPDARLDIVPADFVGRAIATIHLRGEPKHPVYHLSSGPASLSYKQIVTELRRQGYDHRPLFAPKLTKPATALAGALARTPRSWGVAYGASLFQVFLPYLAFDTVFDNRRVVEELGESPPSFGQYAHRLLRFALEHGFKYPYRPWPAAASAAEDLRAAAAAPHSQSSGGQSSGGQSSDGRSHGIAQG